MKKILTLCSSILLLSNYAKANDQIIIYQANQCNPPATGNNYDYVSPVSTNHVFVHFLGLHCTVKTINCDDPGSTACSFGSYQVPDLDFDDVTLAVTEQMNNGILEGQTYSTGVQGTGTLENFTSEPNTTSYIWGANGSPTCRTIKVVYNDGIE